MSRSNPLCYNVNGWLGLSGWEVVSHVVFQNAIRVKCIDSSLFLLSEIHNSDWVCQALRCHETTISFFEAKCFHVYLKSSVTCIQLVSFGPVLLDRRWYDGCMGTRCQGLPFPLFSHRHSWQGWEQRKASWGKLGLGAVDYYSSVLTATANCS